MPVNGLENGNVFSGVATARHTGVVGWVVARKGRYAAAAKTPIAATHDGALQQPIRGQYGHSGGSERCHDPVRSRHPRAAERRTCACRAREESRLAGGGDGQRVHRRLSAAARC